MTPLRFAWLNLVRHKGTTFLALVSLGLTVGCSGILLRLDALAKSRFSGLVLAGDALIGAKAGPIETLLGCLNLEGAYPGFIPTRLYHTLLTQDKIGFADAEVETRLHRLIIPILYCGKLDGYRLIGTTEGFLHQPDPGPKSGLTAGQWAGSRFEVVLGAEVAQRKNLRVGDPILVHPWTSDDPTASLSAPYSMKVAGVLAKMNNAWDKALFTNLNEAKQILTAGNLPDNPVWGKDVLHYLIVYLLPGKMEPLRTLVNQRTVAEVTEVAEARKSLEALTGAGRKLGILVVILVLILGGLSMSGLMVARHDAKTKQLTILRAMGFARKELLEWMVWEGFFLTAGAFLMGSTLDCLLFPFFRMLLGTTLPSTQDLPSHVWQSWPVWILALAAIQGSALIPLWRFSVLNPRESLQNLSG